MDILGIQKKDLSLNSTLSCSSLSSRWWWARRAIRDID